MHWPFDCEFKKFGRVIREGQTMNVCSAPKPFIGVFTISHIHNFFATILLI